MKRDRIILFIKLIILIISFGFIGIKVVNKEQFSNLYNTLLHFNNIKFFYLSIVFLLMFFNWAFESIKWQILISKLQKIKFIETIKAIFAGITISVFTPNRVGEFAGRIIVLEKENRIQGIFSTLVGNVAQVIMTVILGLVAILIIPFKYNNLFIESQFTPKVLSYFAAIIAFAILLLYYNMNIFSPLLGKINFLKKHRESFDVFFSYKRIILSEIVLLSAFRYSIFIIQFYLLLIVFNVNIGFYDALISIFLIYFTMTVIPTIALGEIGIRGSVAIYFLSCFSDNLSGILFSTITIWIINLAIPALIGSVIIYKSKI